uniref:non-specific protein-tyrosine kinase n=1 Tax=Acrobeloides nanus TaxID=290746 RepID=A0A914BXU4_9BILA
MSSNADKRSSIITPSLISKTDLTLKDVIGRGHYGVVLKSTWKHRDGIEIECAVKVLTQSPEKLVQEIVHMQKLSHENIVQLYGVCLEEPVLMVLELCDGGSLAARLKDHSKPTPLVTTLLKYAIQIAEGMRYLETQGYVHRDLAARNVLLTKDEQTAKIADFGLTRHLEPDQSLYEMSQNAQLPFSWCPPESLRYKKFSSQSDVWAFGVTIWEMFQYEKEDPWMNLSSRMVLEKIEAGERLSKPLYCPQEIYKIMLECWDFVPQARPNFTILTNKLKGFEFDVFDLDKKEKSAYEAPIGSPHSNKFIIVDYDDLDNIIAQNVSSGKFCKFSPDGELTEIENNDTSLLPPVQPRTSSSRTDTTLFPPIQRRTSSSRTDSTFSAHKPPVVKKPTFLSEH